MEMRASDNVLCSSECTNIICHAYWNSVSYTKVEHVRIIDMDTEHWFHGMLEVVHTGNFRVWNQD